MEIMTGIKIERSVVESKAATGVSPVAPKGCKLIRKLRNHVLGDRLDIETDHVPEWKDLGELVLGVLNDPVSDVDRIGRTFVVMCFVWQEGNASFSELLDGQNSTWFKSIVASMRR